jgi:hypothetical protein
MLVFRMMPFVGKLEFTSRMRSSKVCDLRFRVNYRQPGNYYLSNNSERIGRTWKVQSRRVGLSNVFQDLVAVSDGLRCSRTPQFSGHCVRNFLRVRLS